MEEGLSSPHAIDHGHGNPGFFTLDNLFGQLFAKVDLGADFVSVGSDLRLMMAGAAEVVKAFRDGEAGSGDDEKGY